MAQSSSDRTLMGLLASELDKADSTDAPAEGLPTLDARTEMFLRAVHGRQTPTAEQRAAARSHVLDAMAADLAAETADLAAPPQSAVPAQASRAAAASAARSSAGWAEMRGKMAEPLLKLFAPAGEIFAMRAVRMVAVPLLAVLVVGSIWTGMLTDREPDSPGAEISPGADTPRTRGLATPVERDLKRDIAAAQAARGPAHPEVASKMADLAALYRAQKRYTDAEELYTRALTIQRNALGAGHADVVRTTRDLAEVYRAQGRVTEADDLLRRAHQP
jgi:tetratricopeptide (TPR) repeat protein